MLISAYFRYNSSNLTHTISQADERKPHQQWEHLLFFCMTPKTPPILTSQKKRRKSMRMNRFRHIRSRLFYDYFLSPFNIIHRKIQIAWENGGEEEEKRKKFCKCYQCAFLSFSFACTFNDNLFLITSNQSCWLLLCIRA